MKINFSRLVKFTPEFNNNKSLPEDQQIKFVLRSMSIGDFTESAAFIHKISRGNKEVSSDNLDVEQTLSIIKNVGRFVPQHVEEMKGLEDNDGLVGVPSLVSFLPFFPLASEVLLQLLSISAPNADDVGNSTGQPA